MLTRRQLLLGTLLTTATVHAQELAHAGWRGNSIAPEVWWQHAAFVRFPDTTTFAEVVKALDAISQIGADSILLPDLQPTNTQPFASRFGTDDDLDALIREVAARRMHLLLRMPISRAASNPGEVRFWMNRGIVGLDLGTLGSDDMDAVTQLRSTLDHYPGHRILLARTPGVAIASTAQATSSRRRKTPAATDPITLHILSPEDAESGATQGASLTAVEIAVLPADKSDATSAAEQLPGAVPHLLSLTPLLLAPGAPIIDSRLLASPGGRDSLQQVLAFRNSHATIRTGAVTVLQTAQPSLKAWLLRSRKSRESLLLAANEGKEPATLHLTAALASQGIRGAYLRPLLRSDHGMGAVNVEEGSLPPGSAILADIHIDHYR